MFGILSSLFLNAVFIFLLLTDISINIIKRAF